MIDTSGMLALLYSNSGPAVPALSSNPVTALKIAENIETTAVATQARQPTTARDITAFKAAVTAAKTPQQLLQNPTVLKVLLTVNGLADQLNYTALAQKALLSDPTKTNSLANQLSGTNGNWLTAAKAYSFATQGLSMIKNPTTLSAIANAYAQQTWMTSLDQGTPGLSNALNFRSQAASIKSVDQILGNSTLRNVVTTALGLPPEIAYQQLTTQEQAITSRLDIKQFQNANFVETFTQRYLLAASNAAGTTSTTPDLTTLAEQSILIA